MVLKIVLYKGDCDLIWLMLYKYYKSKIWAFSWFVSCRRILNKEETLLTIYMYYAIDNMPPVSLIVKQKSYIMASMLGHWAVRPL